MGKKKKDDSGQKKKKDSGPAGCGGRSHTASSWGGEKSLKNSVINCGFLEAFLTALDAEDADLPGLEAFSKIETKHSLGPQLVEVGRELANGKRQGPAHHRTMEAWGDGPAAWMLKAKEVFSKKVMAGGLKETLLGVGERYRQWASVAGNDASVPYRRMKAVADKLDEIGLSGGSAMGAIENEAFDGKLPWLFFSMEETERRKKAKDDARKRAEAAAEAARKAAEAKANAGK